MSYGFCRTLCVAAGSRRGCSSSASWATAPPARLRTVTVNPSFFNIATPSSPASYGNCRKSTVTRLTGHGHLQYAPRNEADLPRPPRDDPSGARGAQGDAALLLRALWQPVGQGPRARARGPRG